MSKSTGGAGGSFIGHILTMDTNQPPKTALTWAPEGREVVADQEKAGTEPQRKKGQPLVFNRGVKRQWLHVTVRRDEE